MDVHECPSVTRGEIGQRWRIAAESSRSLRASERTRTADPFITSHAAVSFRYLRRAGARVLRPRVAVAGGALPGN
jgi:hypothetical protein